MPAGNERAVVGLLSHRGGNIGHDFMALGVEELMRRTFGEQCEIRHLEHHQPFEVYGRRHPLRILNRYPHGRANAAKRFVLSKAVAPNLVKTSSRALEELRLAVVCGGPALHAGAAGSVDMGLMYLHMPHALAHRGVPVANISVGSCYPLKRVPAEITDAGDNAFFRSMFDAVRETTVRDVLAQELVSTLGSSAELIPCPSLVAGYAFDRMASPTERRVVVINAQSRGANEDWGQNVDQEAWRSTLAQLVDRLKARHEVLFVAHDSREVAFLRTVDAAIPCELPTTLSEYAAILARAKGGLTTRIHAALPLASVGCSPVVVGTDTRLGTPAAVGLATHFVKDADAEMLEAEIEDRLARASEERDRLTALREATAGRYEELFQGLAS